MVALSSLFKEDQMAYEQLILLISLESKISLRTSMDEERIHEL